MRDIPTVIQACLVTLKGLQPIIYAPKTPEEHQDSLRKGLEIVVAVDLSSVDHGYFPKHLKADKEMSLNEPASLYTMTVKWRVTWWKQSTKTHHTGSIMSGDRPAFQWQHRWRTAWLSGAQHKGEPGWNVKRRVWDAVNNSITLWYKSCAYTTALAQQCYWQWLPSTQFQKVINHT